MHSEILKVMPLKEKQSIYLFTLGLTYCPADLSFIIDDYFRDYSSLQGNYKKYKDSFII